MNTKISTEAKLVGADDVSRLILWTNIFLEAQVYKVDQFLNIKIIKVLSYYMKTEKSGQLKG